MKSPVLFITLLFLLFIPSVSAIDWLEDDGENSTGGAFANAGLLANFTDNDLNTYRETSNSVDGSYVVYRADTNGTKTPFLLDHVYARIYFSGFNSGTMYIRYQNLSGSTIVLSSSGITGASIRTLNTTANDWAASARVFVDYGGYSVPVSRYYEFMAGYNASAYRDRQINFTMYDYVNNVPITSDLFNVSMYDENGTFITEFIGTNAGSLWINMTPYAFSNYTFVLNDTNYFSVNTTVNYTPTGTYDEFYYYSEAFQTFPVPTLNLHFRDEITREFITNVNYSLIFSDIATEHTSVTGDTDDIHLNATGDLEIVYNKANYDLRKYFVEIIENTNTSLNLYLLNQGNSTEISYLLTDENGIGLSGAVLKVLRRYIINDTTTYEIVTMSTADESGQGVVFLQQNEATYYFIVEYLGNAVLTTSPQTIFSTTKTLSAVLSDDVIQSTVLNVNLTQSLTFNDTTYNFTYTWNDPTNLVDEVCVYVEKITGRGAISINSSCVTGSPAGTIILGIGINATGNYIAKVITDTNTAYTRQLTDYLEVILTDVAANLGTEGMFWVGLLAIGLGLIFTFIAGPIAGIIGLTIGVVAAGMFGLITFGWGMAMFLIAIAIVFIVGMAKRGFG